MTQIAYIRKGKKNKKFNANTKQLGSKNLISRKIKKFIRI